MPYKASPWGFFRCSWGFSAALRAFGSISPDRVEEFVEMELKYKTDMECELQIKDDLP
jgi:hypothetical protein